MQTRVLFVRSDIKLAGPGRLMLASALALREIGIEVVFATSGGEMVAEVQALGFKHFTLADLAVGKRSISGVVRSAWQINRIVRSEKISVLHSYNAQAGLTCIPAKLINRTLLFNTVLGNGKENLLRIMPFKLIAVSKSVAEKLYTFGVPRNKIKVIYNSTLDDRFVLKDRNAYDSLKTARAQITPFTFISVAILTGHKGHAEILDALAAYHTRSDAIPIRMVFVGDGPQQKAMQTYASTLGLTEVVNFIGASSQVEWHLDRAHVFIHLPEMETFGMVLAEANARGLPVIAANVGGIPEVIVDGRTGILVDRNQPEKIAEAIAQLIGNPDLLDRFGSAGAMHAASMFNKKNLARDLQELYSSKREK